LFSYRKLHNEKLHDLYYLPSIIRIIKKKRMRWVRHVASRKKRNTYRLLVGKPLGRPKCMWVENIKMNLGGIGWGGVGWIGLAQNWDKRRALVNVVMNLRVP
jgi:hypothetical protein